MNSTNDNTSSTTWKLPTLAWIAFIASGALLAILFHEGIRFLLRQWDSPEYGYAYLIPVITAFLIWQKKDLLETFNLEVKYAPPPKAAKKKR